jgi:NitT/TauT family transport system permease protein
MNAIVRVGPPLVFGALLLVVWEAIVRLAAIPPYVLPAPSVIAAALIEDRAILLPALAITLGTTAVALLTALVGGVALAILFDQARWIERSLLPFAIVLQVTPVVAIAPLLLVYLEPSTAVRVCAFLVAFFPILSNTALGLAAADRNLGDLFALNGASRLQTLLLLRLPTALPYLMAGLRIGGGLALIGAVVAELVAGAAGQGAGLAFRIAEAGYRLNIPRMFAGLALVSFAGIAIFVVLAGISQFALRRRAENDTARN